MTEWNSSNENVKAEMICLVYLKDRTVHFGFCRLYTEIEWYIDPNLAGIAIPDKIDNPIKINNKDIAGWRFAEKW